MYLFFLLTNAESYEPVIRMRREKVDTIEKEKGVTAIHPQGRSVNVRQLMVVVLTRPIRIFLEPMVFFTDLFLVLEYAMFFLYFEAYPFIFKGASTTKHKPLRVNQSHVRYRYVRYEFW